MDAPTQSTESSTRLASEIIARIRSVVGASDDFVPLHEPRFAGAEWEHVKACLDTGWVSSVGSYVDQFEDRLAATCGARHAVALVNGTTALEIALRVVGVQAGDEVLLPALTFVATANAVAHIGATPHFVDSCPKTLGMDPSALRGYLAKATERQGDELVNRATGRRIAAILPMHVFGHPVEMQGILDLANELSVPLVEDAAEALGSLYRGKPTGAIGTVGILSFNGNKILTTGGGGALVTNNSDLAKRAKHLSTTAKVPHRWAFEHDEVGFNYRLPNLNAALGCAQLDQLDRFLVAKRKLATAYIEAFSGLDGVHVLQEPEGASSNYWLNTLILSKAYAGHRDAILDATNDAGLQCRPAWTLMHMLPMYRDCPRMPLELAEDMSRRIINIPSSVKLGLAKHA